MVTNRLYLKYSTTKYVHYLQIKKIEYYKLITTASKRRAKTIKKSVFGVIESIKFRINLFVTEVFCVFNLTTMLLNALNVLLNKLLQTDVTKG
jgi:hypothetical protein